MLRHLLTTTTNVERSSYVWSITASVCFAAQSVVMLFIVSNLLGVEDAGLFALAVAQAIILWAIGSFGMRKYQASDVNRLYCLREYVWSRVLSVGLMMLSASVFLLVMAGTGHYSGQKAWIIFLVTLIRAVDAVEDVWVGFFQQIGRLDIGSRVSSARVVLNTLVFAVALIVTRDLSISLLFCLAASVILLVILLVPAMHDYREHNHQKAQARHVAGLLWTCAPLFLAAFLSMYITNAPKYGIDAVLDDTAQGQFNLISMPVFVISLLSFVIFNPLIYSMSTQWIDRNLKRLFSTIATVTLITIGITVVCVIGGVLIGLPILSFISGVALTGLRTDLAILLVAGGFVAMSNLFIIILTIMRRQVAMAWSLVVVAGVAMTSPLWISWQGLRGACLIFLVVFVLQTIIMGAVIWRNWHRPSLNPVP
ncbi:MAG: oligosaccharide flippase family protein [Propionibacteriaceae bacterium]|nr:oligosaccharide flippase family protein [Propionibacteriaceae bacterium]